MTSRADQERYVVTRTIPATASAVSDAPAPASQTWDVKATGALSVTVSTSVPVKRASSLNCAPEAVDP